MSQPAKTWSRDQVVPLLEQVELFRGLPDDELDRVAAIATSRVVRKGQVLFEEGEPGDAYYIVYQGAVELERTRSDGVQRLAVRRRGQGFGEMALLNDAPRSATARAASDATLMALPRDDFRQLLAGDTLPLRLLHYLASALRVMDGAVLAADGGDAADGQGACLDRASRIIQRGILTRDAPRVTGYDIAAGTTLEPHGAGSTVWDAFDLPGGRTALLVLGVRTAGLPRAHVLGAARTALRVALDGGDDPARLLARANDALAGTHVDGVDQFVDCAVVVPDGDEIAWACAGRMEAAILGRDATLAPLGSHGPPLGMMKGFGYGTERATLGSGTRVLVLGGGTTGLFRGAADLVAEVQGKPAGEVVSTIHRAIRKSGGGHEISVLFLRRH